MLEELQGQIERITYTSEETGYTVARLKVYGRKDLVTIVGNILSPMAGEILRMKGEWSSHPKYGEQFKVASYETKVPATIFGIEKYLGSGLIKGIGPVMAKRIVKMFGEESLDIIEHKSERLAEVEGIGDKRVGMIRQAWAEQKDIRDVMLFLQSNGVGPGYATKIFKQYGRDSIKVVTENPYRMAMDIFGIGFVTADTIAGKLGFPKDSELRLEAGLLYVLHQLSEDGNVYFPYQPLIDKCKEILKVDENEIIVKAIDSMASDKRIVIEDIPEAGRDDSENSRAVYLSKFHQCETGIAGMLKGLMQDKALFRDIDSLKALERVQAELSIQLAEKQISAVKNAIDSKVMVITGGPGTGKTTIIKSVIRIFARMNMNILLAAPTGRAAKRMNEATGVEAKTIHRLLSYSYKDGGFQMDENNQLTCDLLIIDEASMIDTVLMYHLLKAVPLHAVLILVGDVNQLPSVGAGNVLKDIISSGAVPVAELSEIFRQAKGSNIIVAAHNIIRGFIPSLDAKDGDFYFIEKEDPEDVVRIIIEMVKTRIPGRFGFDPVDDIQVLTPMNRGAAGTVNLNKELQEALNPRKDGIVRGNRNYRVGDKVMQIRNNYDKEVYNGDIGRIIRIDSEEQEVHISIDGKSVVYDFSELDEVVHAYAVSVHKSQGSEYPAVIIPILIQHYILLQRNLIYTAITRGKKLVVVVGTRKAMAIGVKNDRTEKRYTYLSGRLM